MLDRILALATVSSILVVLPTVARADREFHTLRQPLLATGAAGHPELRRGQVIVVHSDGDPRATYGLYVVNGAAPLTTYHVVLDVSLFGCSGPFVVFPLGTTVVTDEHGNGTGSAVFEQDDLRGLGVVGRELGIVRRLVTSSGVTAYSTGACAPTFIDDNRNGR